MNKNVFSFGQFHSTHIIMIKPKCQRLATKKSYKGALDFYNVSYCNMVTEDQAYGDDTFTLCKELLLECYVRD